MKYGVLLALALCSFGCSTGFLNPGVTRVRAEKAEEQARQDELERQRVIRSSFHAGDSPQQIKELWGTPDWDEYKDGVQYFRYENENEPITFGFKDDKLTEWTYDHGAIERHQREAAMEKARRRALAAQEAQERGQALANGLKAYSESMKNSEKKRIHCTSTRFGNSIDTDCN